MVCQQLHELYETTISGPIISTLHFNISRSPKLKHCNPTIFRPPFQNINTENMASRGNTPHWHALKVSFTTENQAEEWEGFYIHVIDFLKALDINTEIKHDSKKAGNC